MVPEPRYHGFLEGGGSPSTNLVDLGLPSGLLWARSNVGARTLEEAGLYFSWGNLIGHAEGSGYDFSQEVYDTTPAAAITDNLSLSQDAARANLGAPWRMPTAAEFQELYDNCTSEWTTINGVAGRLFTSNVNGNTLFFPAAGNYNGTSLISRRSSGYYWSSTYYSATSALFLYFNSSIVNPQNNNNRRYGFSVRAVVDPALLTRSVISPMDSDLKKDISPMNSDLEKAKSDIIETMIEDESR